MGTPEIGTRFSLSNNTMAISNAILVLLFGFALFKIIRKKKKGLNLLIGLVLFDIIAEFTFHGIGFITASVIVAVILIIFSLWYKRKIVT